MFRLGKEMEDMERAGAIPRRNGGGEKGISGLSASPNLRELRSEQRDDDERRKRPPASQDCVCVCAGMCDSGMRENRVDRSHDADYSQLPSVTALVVAGCSKERERGSDPVSHAACESVCVSGGGRKGSALNN